MNKLNVKIARSIVTLMRFIHSPTIQIDRIQNPQSENDHFTRGKKRSNSQEQFDQKTKTVKINRYCPQQASSNYNKWGKWLHKQSKRRHQQWILLESHCSKTIHKLQLKVLFGKKEGAFVNKHRCRWIHVVWVPCVLEAHMPNTRNQKTNKMAQ